MESWTEEAARYFFNGMGIGKVARLVGKSRQAVSAELKKRPGYRAEKERRKLENEKKRRAYKTEKQRAYRAEAAPWLAVSQDTLRREHDLAALELSRERYH